MPTQYELYAANGDRLNTFEDEGPAIDAAHRHDGSRVDRVVLTVESIEQVWPKVSTMVPDDIDEDDSGYDHIIVIPAEVWDAIEADRILHGEVKHRDADHPMGQMLMAAAMAAPDPDRRGYELIVTTDSPHHPSQVGDCDTILETMWAQIAADFNPTT